jgi:hypothetical protein
MCVDTVAVTDTVEIDRYILDTLLADLVGHDRAPSSYVVYLYLWSRTFGSGEKSVRASHQTIAADTGFSKSGVQAALRHLNRRRLVRSVRETQTSTPCRARRRA